MNNWHILLDGSYSYSVYAGIDYDSALKVYSTGQAWTLGHTYDNLDAVKQNLIFYWIGSGKEQECKWKSMKHRLSESNLWSLL